MNQTLQVTCSKPQPPPSSEKTHESRTGKVKAVQTKLDLTAYQDQEKNCEQAPTTTTMNSPTSAAQKKGCTRPRNGKEAMTSLHTTSTTTVSDTHSERGRSLIKSFSLGPASSRDRSTSASSLARHRSDSQSTTRSPIMTRSARTARSVPRARSKSVNKQSHVDSTTNSKLISSYLQVEGKPKTEKKMSNPQGKVVNPTVKQGNSTIKKDTKESKERSKAQGIKTGPTTRSKPSVTPFR